MARNHWTILGELDPELNDKIASWRTHLVNDNDKLERKYRELVNVAMACILKQEPVIPAHAKLALENGGNKGRGSRNRRTGADDGRFSILPLRHAYAGRASA